MIAENRIEENQLCPRIDNIEKLLFFLTGLTLRSTDLLGDGEADEVDASSSSRCEFEAFGETLEEAIVLVGEKYGGIICKSG